MNVAGEIPGTPGMLFHRPDGPSGCPSCGWSGAPTFVGGRRLDLCPGCEIHDELAARRVEKVGRNDPCPCDSGAKFKKCCGRAA